MKRAMVASLVALSAFAFAGSPSLNLGAPSLQDEAARSAKVQENMRRVDLLRWLMPLVLRKDQFDKILPVFAKIKSEQRKVLEDEDKQFLALEKELEEAIRKAKEENVFPKRDLVTKCIRLVQALGLRRRMARADLTEEMYKVVDSTLDAGQKKAMTAIEWKEIDPTAELEGKPDADKIRFFVRVVLLDPLAYDILIDLDKRARAGG